MFNWLFDKKKSVELPAAVETTIVNEEITEAVIPVYEETPKEKSNIDMLFEVFPTLKHLCDMQFEMDQKIYVTSSAITGLIAPKFTDVSHYKKLVGLPEISKVMSNSCHHHEGKLYSYLSVNNEYVNIVKVDRYGYDPRLYPSVDKINPPVLRVAENLSNNADSWDMLVKITNISEGTSETVGYTEECIKNLKKGLVGYPMEIRGHIEVRKYLIKGDIEISISEKTLKVKSDKINLSNGEVGMLTEISLDYERKLIQNAKLEFEKEENQKRAAMDEVVAELFKGE